MVELDHILLVSYLIKRGSRVKVEACHGVFHNLLLSGRCHILLCILCTQASRIEALRNGCLRFAFLAKGVANDLLIANFVFDLLFKLSL